MALFSVTNKHSCIQGASHNPLALAPSPGSGRPVEQRGFSPKVFLGLPAESEWHCFIVMRLF